MHDEHERPDPHRRRSLALLGAGTAVLWLNPAWGLEPTPRQSRGPFYPDELPLDHDNDLVIVGADGERAAGVITDLRGTVRAPDGSPVDGARVEIWQCDATGHYVHRRERTRGERDPNFQGFGVTRTNGDGAYRFRTIRPVPYPGRAPHIHFRVVAPGGRELITQMYVAGHPRNERDWILSSAAEPGRLIVPFERVDDPAFERRARFDIVMPA